VINKLNFAHADIFMFGGIIGLFLSSHFHLNVWFLILCVMAGSGLLGILVEITCFRFVRKEYEVAPLLASIGFGVVLTNLAYNYTLGDLVRFPVTLPFSDIQVLEISISSSQFLMFIIAMVLMITLTVIVQKSRLGRGMRALGENFDAARLLGINVNRVIVMTFFFASILAGTAGILVGIRFGKVSPFIGELWGVKGLVLTIIGGLGSLWGSMIMGIIAGLLEVLIMTYGSAAYADGVVWALLVAILFLRPQGLFGMPRGTTKE
jgi:branched-chain amino acid transport system permease protein